MLLGRYMGGFGRPVEDQSKERRLRSGTVRRGRQGGALALRGDVWAALGGMVEGQPEGRP